MNEGISSSWWLYHVFPRSLWEGNVSEIIFYVGTAYLHVFTAGTAELQVKAS